ncbi:hypothetical protein J0X14_07660 [Muricauda sp. CAU 1633]|uniref:hypothetical protein n=1 Tax=Allomuricauda sp. CAU 1633 TaxID=2816036 RepID=UPI001A8E02C4|nr:hypothetical protein [Muricauda sp. CAU 1633]MBO0322167.1 hypothetical protein [Muricauda sp. CAU 1633]
MSTKPIYFKLFGTLSVSIAVVILLFLASEKQVHRNNAFTRRYPPHPVIKSYDLDLGYNSYYIAGIDKDILYLGNSTAPLHLLRIRLGDRDTTHIELSLETDLDSVRTKILNIQVLPPYFFALDGITPMILRGSTDNWQATVWAKDRAYFSKAQAIDSNRIAIRSISAKTGRSVLGLMERDDSLTVTLHPDILERKLDGIFDVDGAFTITPDQRHIGYVYFYRNQYLILDDRLHTLQKRSTIDTVQEPQIKLTSLSEKGTTEMSAPPLFINLETALYDRYLMIHSNRLGKNEPTDMLDEASIIDVYDWKEGTYAFSFYIHHVEGQRLKEFKLFGDHLVALMGRHLSIYQLVDAYFTKSTGNPDHEK